MRVRENDVEELRKVAESYIMKGELAKALIELKRLAELKPDDLQLQRQIGDLLRKVGREGEAIVRYKYVLAESLKKGELLQAIALAKYIIEIEPEDSETKGILSEISSRKNEILSRRAEEAQPLPFFGDLPEEGFRHVLERIKTQHFDKGDFICKEGERGDSLFFINHGELVIYKYTIKEKKEVLLNVLKEGDFFGEFSFFSHQRRSASALAHTTTTLLEITRLDFDEIQKVYPNIKEHLMDLYKKRVVDTILALSPPFNALSPTDRKRLVERFSPHVVEADTTVIHAGSLPRYLYLIKSGRAEVYVTEGGQEVLVGTLAAGDIFGEISLILGRNHTATVKTVTRTELLVATKEDVEEILQLYPQIREGLRKSSEKRLEKVHNKVQTHQNEKKWL